MDKLYILIASWLMKANNGTKDDFEIYKFGIQTAFEQGLYFLVCILISIFMNELGAMLIFLLVFIFVRPYIDGLHFKSFLACFSLSTLISVLIVYLSSEILLNKTTMIIASVILELITYFCLISQSKKFEKNEYNFYLKKLRKNFMIINVILLVLYFFNKAQGIVIIALTFALIIMLFIIGELKKILMKNKTNLAE